MPYLRFNHVFVSLMLVSFVTAFVFAPKRSDAMRQHLQGLYKPVATPVRWVAGAFHGRASPAPADPESPTGNPRASDEIVRQNLALKQELAMLTEQLKKLRERDARLANLGPLRDKCVTFSAIGGDSGSREVLNLGGINFKKLRKDDVVLTDGGDLAGVVDRAGATGGTVRLITDKGSHFLGSIARFTAPSNGGRQEYVGYATELLAVEGVGDNLLRANTVPMKQISATEMAVGDWLMLNDPDWPEAVRWTRAGRVVKIGARHDAAGFAEILIRPVTRLKELREVLVVVE